MPIQQRGKMQSIFARVSPSPLLLCRRSPGRAHAWHTDNRGRQGAVGETQSLTQEQLANGQMIGQNKIPYQLKKK